MPRRCLTLLACTLPLVACGVRPTPASRHTQAPVTDGAVVYRNPFPPVELVVHPLTRITRDPSTGDRRIEAHFELLDRYGHTVKALGKAAIELRVVERGTSGVSGGPRQLRRWTIDLSNPDDNAQPFDRVTRTYRLTLLDLPANLPPEETLSVVVRFTTNDGVLLAAERRLERER